MYEVITEATFEAAHLVPGHPKCGHLHGHTWKVVVCLRSETVSPPFGFVTDFGDVKAALAEILPDHRYLNDEYDFIPTSEALSRAFYHELHKRLTSDAVTLAWVEVWEGAKNRARYYE